ncbi:type 1 glutamine amidotransferase [Rhodobium gokarnense]|uniref:GMP synthase (Glutamine-hydrolyzing) n=1 Tax=Rhodobium gokarnense TaxID=364296 RepID=A0ABT3HG50_9HYPH|nr:type 1 glutamine amidotransferase [Rhodobium gokarnense]MCW2309377.1 GMP synthase (glutamine-hydrolyzing) [Rhodobium gokarnense]
METIHIGILKAGSAPQRLAARKGDYDTCFRELLVGAGPFRFSTFAVEDGVFPDGADAADAWLITGARHGVYEDHPWIAPLEALIRDIRALGRPLVGICFGHQIVAQALGGKVERAAAGWIVGPQQYRTVSGRSFWVNAWHRDQVTHLPPDAEVLASGENCPYAALRYPGPVLTLQPHPELAADDLLDLLAERAGALTADQYAYVERTARRNLPDLDYVVPVLGRVLSCGRIDAEARATSRSEQPEQTR